MWHKSGLLHTAFVIIDDSFTIHVLSVSHSMVRNILEGTTAKVEPNQFSLHPA